MNKTTPKNPLARDIIEGVFVLLLVGGLFAVHWALGLAGLGGAGLAVSLKGRK